MELYLMLHYLLAWFNIWIVSVVKKNKKEKRLRVGGGCDETSNNFKCSAAKPLCD